MTPRSPEPSLDAHDAAVEADDAVVADAVVVDGEVVSITTSVSDVPFVDDGARTTIEAVRPGALTVAARTAAVVGTGFVAGAIATAVVARKAGVLRRPASRRSAVPGRSQRFLVDVHLLGDR